MGHDDNTEQVTLKFPIYIHTYIYKRDAEKVNKNDVLKTESRISKWAGESLLSPVFKKKKKKPPKCQQSIPNHLLSPDNKGRRELFNGLQQYKSTKNTYGL